jgi:hypothetical protein
VIDPAADCLSGPSVAGLDVEKTTFAGKKALQHRILFAAVMAMGGKSAAGRVAQDAGGERLVDPRQVPALHHNPLADIGMQLHGDLLIA